MRIFERERSPPDRTPRRVVVGLALAALASVALIAAGCGGDSDSPGVALAPSGTTATQPSEAGDSESDNPIAFSACMRAHGVPDFPDPKVTSGGEITSIPDSDSPRFTAALNSCRYLLPDGGVSSPEQQAQEQAALLKFAACVRAHGVPEFPDPTVAGGRARFPEDAIPRSSPRFGAAKKACRQSLAGDDASVTGG
jgi:hypothetical protein